MIGCRRAVDHQAGRGGGKRPAPTPRCSEKPISGRGEGRPAERPSPGPAAAGAAVAAAQAQTATMSGMSKALCRSSRRCSTVPAWCSGSGRPTWRPRWWCRALVPRGCLQHVGGDGRAGAIQRPQQIGCQVGRRKARGSCGDSIGVGRNSSAGRARGFGGVSGIGVLRRCFIQAWHGPSVEAGIAGVMRCVRCAGTTHALSWSAHPFPSSWPGRAAVLSGAG